MKLTRVLFFAVGLLVAAGGFSQAGAAIGQLWARHEGSASYFDEMDHCVAVVSDAQGNVYTAGTGRDTVTDTLCYVTTKYNQWGRIVWRSFDTYPQYFPYLDTPPPTPQLVLDTSGNLYLGETEMLYWEGQRWGVHGIRVIKFNGSNGSKIWNQNYRFGGPSGYTPDSYLSGMVYDSVYRSLFLASTEYWYHSDVGSNYDFGIEKIDPSNGSAVWDSAYHQTNGVVDAEDIATGICLSAITRDPVITGYCQDSAANGKLYNWVTASFNRSTGARLWARPWRRDSVTDDEMPWAITSDSTGIYVAGGIYQDNESQYGWALLKLQLGGSIVNADTDYTAENNYYDNWLTSVKTTVGTGGRAYAAGWVDRNLTSSLDWLVIGDTSGPRQTSLLRLSWRTTKDHGLQNDDQTAAVVLDNQDRPWVMGYFDDDTVFDWGVSRFAADGTSSPNLLYHRNDNWDDAATPTALAVRDTNHIYVGGFTLDDSQDENHTVVRFGANIPSAALDSFRDSSFAFAWRDTVDSGATVRVNAFYHNTGYSLATPKLKASLSSFYADSVTDTLGAPPESARAALMTGRWTALQRGPQVMKCTLNLAGDTSAANNLRTRNVYVRVGDVGPDSLGFADTVGEDTAFRIAARVRNYGNAVATFPIAFQVGDTIKDTTVTALPAGGVARVASPTFTMPGGKYRVRTYTQYAADLNRSNDTLDPGDTVFIPYRDITCVGILAPAGDYNESTLVTPTAIFKNLGNVTTTFRADFVIPPPSDKAQLPTIRFQPSAPSRPSAHSPQPPAFSHQLPAAGDQPPAPQFAVRSSQSADRSPQLAPVVSGSAKNPGMRKFAVRSSQFAVRGISPTPRSSVPSPQSAPRTSQSAPRSSQTAVRTSQSADRSSQFAARTPQSAIGTDGAYHDSILSITLAPDSSSVQSFTPWLAAPTGEFVPDVYSVCALDQFPGNDTAYQAFTVTRHDVGAVAILAPVETVQQGNVTPQAEAHNYGSVTETFKFFLRIIGGSPWADSVTMTLASGQDSTWSFHVWSATPGNHATRCSTYLATDGNHLNDTLSNMFVVVRHDVGVVAILAPLDTVLQGNVSPQATVHNYGSVPETFEVYFRITGGTPWNDSFALALPSGRDSTISFRNWVATPGNYSGRCSTGLAFDANRSNDTLRAGFVVVQHDVGVVAILAPQGVLDSGTAVTPQAVVRNQGSVTESFFVRFEIGSFYADSQPANLAPGVTDTLDFLGWIASPLGLHVTSCSTMLAGDANPANNRLTDSVRVIPGTGLEEERFALPSVFMLDAPRPNPFSAQTVIRYGLPREAHVAVGIYSATGEFLKSLYRGTQRAGYYSLPGDLGSLPEGVYYCRLVSDEFRAVRKLVKVH